MHVHQKSYLHKSPAPSTVILESDAKRWMQNVIPSLHDHLKAHQFKFQRKSAKCSTRRARYAINFSMRDILIEVLYCREICQLQVLKPIFNPDDLNKISAYLDKSWCYKMVGILYQGC